MRINHRIYWAVAIWLGLMGAWPLAPYHVHDGPWQDAGPWLGIDWGFHLIGLTLAVAWLHAVWMIFDANRKTPTMKETNHDRHR